MSNRLNQDREKELQPKRMQYAKEQIESLGYKVFFEDETCLKFLFKENIIYLFPYSGWHQGQGIKQGRGIEKLLKQIK